MDKLLRPVPMFLLVILLWGLNLLFLFSLDPDDRGTYGDMFGAVNSLFTGLAFAGLLYSTRLQRKQMEQLEMESADRRVIEQNDETLKHCQYYFTEMQISFKGLATDTALGFLPRNLELEEINHSYLKEIHGYYDNIVKGLNPDLLLVLGKLEAFSAIILHGNINVQLARKIIGVNYCVWVNNLTGYIAFYRKGDDMSFCENTLSLWRLWKTIDKK